MKARPLANETERLRVLREYRVLDTARERVFDELVALSAHLCEAPAALITFVDESRQWFKAEQGLALTETHRDLSFCAHTITGSDVQIVPDATLDPRFADNPLVTGAPSIRFYAGAPLISPEGLAVGTLAVIDFKPRNVSPGQVDGLRILARQVVGQLELRRRQRRTEERAAAAEGNLESAAARLRAMFESALDAIVTIDAEGRVTEFNPAAEQLFGYDRVEARGQQMALLIIPPEFREQHAAGFARHLATGEPAVLGRRIEVTAMRRDGSRFPAELTVQRLGERAPVNFVGFIRDITSQRHLTNTLQASAEQYQRQREAMNALIQDDGLYHGDLSAALRRITSTVATTLHVARVSVWTYMKDASVLQCLDLCELANGLHSRGAALAAIAVPAYFEAMRQGEVIAADDARTDPRTREFTAEYLVPLNISSMLDARIHVQGALYGVLCLEHVGEKRQWTPEEQTFAVGIANLVSLAVEGEQRRTAQDALIAKTEILTAVTESLAAYVERGDWQQTFSRLLRCALTLTDSEYGFVGIVADGPALRVLAHEGIVWDKAVNREFYDQALREYDERGYLTFTNFNNLFGHAVTSGEIVIANDTARDRRSTGRPAGHPPMHSFLGVPIRGRDEVTGLIALANRPGGYGPDESSRIEALVRQAGALCDNYRQREHARIQDEERQRVEEALRASEAQVRQSQKLEAVGQLAGGIAHDFNNILTIVDGHTQLLLDEHPHSAETTASLRHIADAVGRAAGLTRQLLAFSRKQVLQTADLDMNVIVGNMMRLLQRILGEHITLSVESSATPAFVRADASMMEQVILNLAINARDAMPAGGRLSLTTRLEVVEARSPVSHPDARPGSFVAVRVADTGTGIPPDTLPHIFEPFFTTKGLDRGTGLGLATVHGVVKQHRGWVTVYSELNKGTTVDVYIPATAQPSPRGPELAAGGSTDRGGETVLLVEDEQTVRSLARIILERRGYQVVEAETGRAALAMWQELRQRIDLLLTDMVMPEGVSGMELASQMLADAPHLAVIVTSGYSIDLATKDFGDIDRVDFLQKPYSPELLARTVRASLDAAAARRPSPNR